MGRKATPRESRAYKAAMLIEDMCNGAEFFDTFAYLRDLTPASAGCGADRNAGTSAV